MADLMCSQCSWAATRHGTQEPVEITGLAVPTSKISRFQWHQPCIATLVQAGPRTTHDSYIMVPQNKINY